MGRARACNWMAVRGDEPLKIMQRAGHTDFRTTQLYVREAEAVREGFGDVFPPLPESLLGGVSGGPIRIRALGGQNDSPTNRPGARPGALEFQKTSENSRKRMGIEPVQECTMKQDSAAIRHVGDRPNVPHRASKCLIVRQLGNSLGNSGPSSSGTGEGRSDAAADAVLGLDVAGVVEPALAEALKLAARAGRWEIVEQIAHELAERRRGRECVREAVCQLEPAGEKDVEAEGA